MCMCIYITIHPPRYCIITILCTHLCSLFWKACCQHLSVALCITTRGKSTHHQGDKITLHITNDIAWITSFWTLKKMYFSEHFPPAMLMLKHTGSESYVHVYTLHITLLHTTHYITSYYTPWFVISHFLFSHFAITHQPIVWRAVNVFASCLIGISSYVWYYQVCLNAVC